MAQPILIKYPIEVEGIARPPAPKEPPVAIDYVAAKRYSQEVDLSNRGQKGRGFAVIPTPTLLSH